MGTDDKGNRMHMLAPMRSESESFPGVFRVEFKSACDGVPDWALLQPPSRGSCWAVVLHGHGSQGDQVFTRPDVRDNWLPRLSKLGLGLLAPNYRGNSWMGPAAAAGLHDLIEWTRVEYGASKFFMIGGSMGGSSALVYSVLHPADLAATLALCPATDIGSYFEWCRQHCAESRVLAEIASAIKSSYGAAPADDPALFRRHSVVKNSGALRMPVCVVHGEKDAVIPVQQAHLLRDVMAEQPSFRYFEVPAGDHDAPLNFASGWNWLAEQFR